MHPTSSTFVSGQKSEAWFTRAKQVMPGGVSSPVRAFKAVGGTPPYIASGQGSRITDIDGNTYIDYVASYGPFIAGHSHADVVRAITQTAALGTTFGSPCTAEVELAELICSALPGSDMVRFVNSGTEAAMSALRLARAATGRDLVVKCVGCYHGHVDALLAEAGSGALTMAMADRDRSDSPTASVKSVPSSAGVPDALVKTTLLVPYNDLKAAEALFAQHGSRIACFAVEPVAGNMGLVLPAPGYLEGLRKLCDQHGALLLFDEVMTGFRVAWGGAQVRYGVKPDITCLGKIIGGGLPVGAYAASKSLMNLVAPVGPMYQAGTLSGNPLAMSAGLALLNICKQPGFYQQLESISASVESAIAQAAREHGVPVALNRCGAMLGIYLTHKHGDVVEDFAQATACDTAAFTVLFHELLRHGVYIPPSMFEAIFPGSAHDPAAIAQTASAYDAAMKAVAKSRKS